ncbi:hypothetical protein H6G94_02620 [Nostoc punctiforme FACHB-252]|uniref:Uncharacterized protein n=1 Tax=Nostoc punctiforme FACHB-252 TaxID=1357509 RepID=A0ABR8H445_NOSPU|nr:hypothetical protein [Nostoc punctiforme]MBD2610178.1 hypothetical protein [Nostoc punctiforme FACHB-252]
MCHLNKDESLCPECLEAQKKSGIDVKRLLLQLAQFKHEYYPQSHELSDKEIKYLCLSLSRYSKGEIAYYFYKHKIPTIQELAGCEDIERWIKNLNAEMSNRIHKYIKRLMNLINENQRLPSWKNIIMFLDKNGYGINKSSTPEIKLLRLLPEGEISVDQLYQLMKKNVGITVKIILSIEHEGNM